MKYKLLKELPFMSAGTVFERQCKDDTECCVFGTSFHNCVKHYDTIQFSENENKILCSIIDNPNWIEMVFPRRAVHEELPLIECTASVAVKRYDAGKITHEQLVRFIEAY